MGETTTYLNDVDRRHLPERVPTTVPPHLLHSPPEGGPARLSPLSGEDDDYDDTNDHVGGDDGDRDAFTSNRRNFIPKKNGILYEAVSFLQGCLPNCVAFFFLDDEQLPRHMDKVGGPSSS